MTLRLRQNNEPGRIQLFRERLSEKVWTRQPRKGIWDMINTLFPNALAVEPTLVACLLYTSPSPRDGLLSRMPSSA